MDSTLVQIIQELVTLSQAHGEALKEIERLKEMLDANRHSE